MEEAEDMLALDKSDSSKKQRRGRVANTKLLSLLVDRQDGHILGW